MRRMVTLASVLLIVTSACTDSPGSTTTTQPAETTSTATAAAPTTTASSTTTTTFVPTPPAHGGTITVGIDQLPPTFNPYAAGGDNFIVWTIAQAIHVGAMDVDGETLELVPEVITEIPSTSNGGLVFNDDGTMTVRYSILPEAHWSDGTTISGDDFAFTYELLSDPDIAAASITAFGGDNPYELIVPGSLTSTDKEVELRLERPTLQWERLFEWIVPRHDVEGSDFLEDWNTTSWVAGGPFALEAEEPIVLTRNDNYWKTDAATGQALPWLDSIEVVYLPENEVMVDAFLSREIDLITPAPFPEAITNLKGTPGVIADVRPGPIWEHFVFQFGPNNRNEASLNGHVLFRRAIAHALDREAIVEEVTSGLGTVLDSYVEAFTPGFTDGSWRRYDHDPDRARALISEVCANLERDCLMDRPVVVFNTTGNAEMRPTVANLVRDQLAAVGVDVHVQLEDSSPFFGETLDEGTWDLGMWAWVGSPGLVGLVDIHDVFDPGNPPPDGTNYSRWGSPGSILIDEHTQSFEDLVEAMDLTADPEVVLELIQQAENELADQVVFIPLFSRLDVAAYWQDVLGGYVHNPSRASGWWNVESWWWMGG